MRIYFDDVAPEFPCRFYVERQEGTPRDEYDLATVQWTSTEEDISAGLVRAVEDWWRDHGASSWFERKLEKERT